MARVKNSVRNISFSLGAQLITTILSFALRTILIESVGIESVALKSLFHEIVSVLALSELGIGSAISYNMIKPLSDGNHVKVRQLMNFYKKAYRIIAFSLFSLGIVICVFVEYFIKGVEFELWYLRLTFMLYVSQSAVSYLLSYKATLLHCDQKGYIATKITTIVKAVGTVAIIFVLWITKNFVAYILSEIVLTLSINIAVSVKVDKMYPYLKGSEKLPREEQRTVFNNVKNIFFKSMAGKIVGSTDNMLISTLVSTLVVGYYANYTTIIMVFQTLMDSIGSGIGASMGNLFVCANKEKCDQVLTRLTYAFFVCAAIFTVGIFNCIQPFICMWIGESFLLPKHTVFIICMVFLLYVMSKPISSAMHYSGMFDIGRNISIAAAVINLVVSIALGAVIGLNGIFIGTICVYVFEIAAKSYFFYSRFLKMSYLRYVRRMISYISGVIILVFMPNIMIDILPLDGYLVLFLVNGIISVVTAATVIIVLSVHTENFKYYRNLLGSSLGRKKS